MRNLIGKSYYPDLQCGKYCRCNCRIDDAEYKNINYNQLIRMMNHGRKVILLDVRSVQEFNEGYLNGAILIPLFELERNVENIIPNKAVPIIVYCSSGVRSIRAIKILLRKGYKDLYNLEGGLENI